MRFCQQSAARGRGKFGEKPALSRNCDGRKEHFDNCLFYLSQSAHHPFGGEAPKTIAEGLLSGIGHPVIGLDHIVFVIAVGLLATIVRKGLAVPISIRYAGFTVLGAEAAFLGGLVV